ncbi:unnamed protein product [Effrenium voratum]|nr:unnamed protein product [Effrenium voratum]
MAAASTWLAALRSLGSALQVTRRRLRAYAATSASQAPRCSWRPGWPCRCRPSVLAGLSALIWMTPCV